MQPLIWDRRPDGLRAPALVCAFQGWNDAGDAASSAVSFLASSLKASRFARVESEEFFDFQANRPCIRFAEPGRREIVWPGVEVFEALAPKAPRDLVLVQGVEPSIRWRAFCGQLIDLAEALGVQLVVSLGALLGDIPHTRPVVLTGHASDPALVERLEMQGSSYEGPTGIVGVLHDACRQAGMPSVSLWAPVPHYVASPPNPKATQALLERLGEVLGMPIGLGDLAEAAVAWEARVNELVGSDADIAAYVRQLEERDDDQIDEQSLPSGDTLAAELERFLRDQRRD